MSKVNLNKSTKDNHQSLEDLEIQIGELVLECSRNVAEAMAKIAESHQKMKKLTEQAFLLKLVKHPQSQTKTQNDGAANG